MSDFQTLLDSIAKRPALYVGNCSIRAVSNYLHGYCQAMSDLGHNEKPLVGWMRWIELRFQISSPAWHWTRILLHNYGSHRAAVEALPELHREFLAERALIGVEGFEAALDRRLIEELGGSWHEPSDTTTTTDD
jgi:hypothetical protein